MISSSSPINILIVFILVSITSATLITPLSTIHKKEVEGFYPNQFKEESRQLQILDVQQNKIDTDFNSLVNKMNQVRSKSSFAALSENARLIQIMNQWSKSLRASMTLIKYLQIFGMTRAIVFQFINLPVEYFQEVVLQQCKECYWQEYKEIGSLIQENAGNYSVLMVIMGGQNSQMRSYDGNAVQAIISSLKQENNSTIDGSVAVNSDSKVESQTKDENKTVTPQPTPSPPPTVTPQPTPSPPTVTPQSTPSPPPTVTPQPTPSPPPTVTPQPTPSPPPTVTPQSTPSPPTVTPQPTPSPPTVTPQPTPSPPTVTPQPTPSPPPTVTPQSTPSPPPTVTPQPTPSNPPTVTPQPTPSPPTVTPQPTPSFPTFNPQQTQPIPQTTIITQILPPFTPFTNPTSTTVLPQQNPNPPQQLQPFTSPVFQPQPLVLPLVTQTTFGATTLNNIRLGHSVPQQFLNQETFNFRGSLSQSNPSGTFVNIIFTRRSDSRRLSFSNYLPANMMHFQIQTLLDSVGDYQISVFSGRQGFADRNNFTINSAFTGSIVSRQPKQIRNAVISVVDNDLQIQWFHGDVSQPCITKLIFSQSNQQPVSFTLTNYVNKFKVPFNKFSHFKLGIVNVQISQAFSNTESANNRTSDFSTPLIITFNATEHHFVRNKKDTGVSQFNLKTPLNTNITLTGIAKETISNQIIVETPKRTFETYLIDNNRKVNDNLPAGTRINVAIPFDTMGVYIVELNDAGGGAIINTPVYVGNIYPLLPDFKDLSPTSIDQGIKAPPQLSARRTLVLDLINIVRKKFNVDTIIQDANLNNLAQSYSQTLINGNFFGHVDRQGKSPGDRAKAVGIFESVGENLASNMNLTQAQLSLQRSPGHLRNMVRQSWTRVGLGIAQDTRNAYFLTQQFSSRDLKRFPITPQQLQDIRQQALQFIIKKYPHLRTQNVQISTALKNYQQQNSQGTISSFLRRNGINKSLLLFNMIVAYNGGDYINLIDQTTNFDGSSRFSQVSLTVAIVDGSLEFFGALS